jgi:hypothetical protein
MKHLNLFLVSLLLHRNEVEMFGANESERSKSLACPTNLTMIKY